MGLGSIGKWIGKLGPIRSARRPTARPHLERLEQREVPTINSLVANFAHAHVHLKVGGGECAHLADEALRVAGANFQPTDPTHTGDYVWGTLLTTITHLKDSKPTVTVMAGDIIQFQNIHLSSGLTATHHTAIVAAVNTAGRPTRVYEQNVGVGATADRTDRYDIMILNAKTITAGTIHIYRPVARKNTANQFQFSVTNDAKKAVTVTLYFNGSASGTLNLSAYNTTNSYNTATFTGQGTWTIGIGTTKLALKNAGGYDVYTTSTGKLTIKAI